MATERHVTFAVAGSRRAEFEKFFVERYHPAMASQPGFRGGELLVREDRPGAYQMVIRFDSADAAARWRASDQHKSLGAGLKALHEGSSVVVYAIVA
jgi:heme-degrading monooxygenase HmoA